MIVAICEDCETISHYGLYRADGDLARGYYPENLFEVPDEQAALWRESSDSYRKMQNEMRAMRHAREESK